MKKQTSYNLTQGPILNRLLLVAIPIMGTQLMQMAYNLTDMFWLGRIGSDAVAASGTAGMYLWLSMAFLLFGRMGSEIGVSQNFGRSDAESAQSFSHTALFIAGCLGIIICFIAAISSGWLISFFNIREKHVADDAAIYLRIVAFGFPASFMSAAITGTFTGSGNSRLPFFANAVGLVLNMILDPLLILVFDLGISGAAIATIMAQSVVFIILILLLRFSKERPFKQYKFFIKPDTAKILKIVKWSIPISIESLLFTALSMIISRFVAVFGSDALAVSRVGSQIESLSWLIGGGFGSAVTSFVGQNFGAGKWPRIRNCYRISIISMTVWGAVTMLVLFFFGSFLFSLFIQEQNIIDMGRQYLKILAFCQIISCLESVTSGVFRGIGETIPPSVSSITGNAIRVPVSYLLSLTPLGLDGIWIGITAGAVLRGCVVLSWYLIRSKRLPHTDAAVKEAGC